MTSKLAFSISPSDLYTQVSSGYFPICCLSFRDPRDLDGANVLRSRILQFLVEVVSVADRGDVVAVPPSVPSYKAEAWGGLLVGGLVVWI